MFKEKNASKCEELDVLRVEVDELKSRPALLGACTSCPVLHRKIDEMHAYIVSLKAKLKELIPTEDHVWFEDWWMVASWCDE
jgi:hypothetical protein